jgi:anti-sigma regulatory factor (Ser/Thr protein kinase)
MEVNASAVRVGDRSAIGEVRRAAVATAQALGLDEAAAGRAGIVAAELAGNALKHGGGGWCFVAPADHRGAPCVAIVAADRGAGIADPGLVLTDGYSTAGTPGTGLGAIKRLSLSFDLYTGAGAGVVIAARVGGRPASERGTSRATVESGAVVMPMEGETASGDAWSLRRSAGAIQVLVADGLGHGVDAAAAAAAAVAAFQAAPAAGAAQLAARVHAALRGTRGAAIAIASLDAAAGRVHFAGIGNIAARLVAEAGTQNLVSMNGTAGSVARSVREFEYAAVPGALLVLHSDGLTGRWRLEDYPGLGVRDPALIAGVLFRDHARGRDDCAVVVLRLPGPAAGGRVA